MKASYLAKFVAEQLGHGVEQQAREFVVGENFVVFAFSRQLSGQDIEILEARGKSGYCGFACFVHVVEVFPLKGKGVVFGDDFADELIKTFLKGFICLVDVVDNVVPCDFDGT